MRLQEILRSLNLGCFQLRQFVPSPSLPAPQTELHLAHILRDLWRYFRLIGLGEGIDIRLKHLGERKHCLRQLFHGGEADLQPFADYGRKA